jgi:hypothetical protein
MAVLLAAGGTSASLDPLLLSTPWQPVAAPQWQVVMRAAGPLTTTDPRHIGVGIGLGRSGASRFGFRYQPSGNDWLGFIHGTIGARLAQSGDWAIAVDAEHAHVWSSRRLYRTTSGFQFEGHDRRQMTLGVLSASRLHTPLFGLITGFEIGAGRMHIRELVAGRLGNEGLNPRLVPVLESAAPVGMVGARLSRRLLFGFDGEARVRLVGAGRSRGGVVPFAHGVVDWEVMRRVLPMRAAGEVRLGVHGSHATSSRAATYYQNGVGVTLKFVF